MVFTDTVLEAGVSQRVRSPGARCGVVDSGYASPDPALETAGCVSPQWVQSSPFWVAAGCLLWVAAGSCSIESTTWGALNKLLGCCLNNTYMNERK
jgi:hypothetical protein